MKNKLLVIVFVSIAATGCLHNRSTTVQPGDYYDIKCKSGYKGSIRVKKDGVIQFSYTGLNGRVLQVECDGAKTEMMERTIENENWRQHISWCNGTNCVHTTVIKKGSVTRQIIDRDGDGKADEDKVSQQTN